LNTLGQFAEGEIYCRRAIGIDPRRPNAFKNLGIALSGQGNYRAAARAFIAATQANAADGRAFQLLEGLLKQHPELEYEFEDELECCRKAVEAVAQRAAELRPVVQKGWRKTLVLLRLRLQSALRRVKSRLG